MLPRSMLSSILPTSAPSMLLGCPETMQLWTYGVSEVLAVFLEKRTPAGSAKPHADLQPAASAPDPVQ
jgi:hypothetical protein